MKRHISPLLILPVATIALLCSGEAKTLSMAPATCAELEAVSGGGCSTKVYKKKCTGAHPDCTTDVWFADVTGDKFLDTQAAQNEWCTSTVRSNCTECFDIDHPTCGG